MTATNNNQQISAIFDFDGTIADTLESFVNVYNSIAPQYNARQIQSEQIALLRSKRPKELMKEFNISLLKLPFMALKIKAELANHVNAMDPFDGMTSALQQLHVDGYRMGIVSSNSKENIMKFLENHNMSNMFEFVYAVKQTFGKHKVIKRAIRENKLEKEHIIYIGDETRDIEAAKQSGAKSIAVTWGFNDRQILEQHAPDYIADNPRELVDIFNKFRQST